MTVGTTLVGSAQWICDSTRDNAANPLLGNIMIIISQLIISVQCVVEERLLQGLGVRPARRHRGSPPQSTDVVCCSTCKPCGACARLLVDVWGGGHSPASLSPRCAALWGAACQISALKTAAWEGIFGVAMCIPLMAMLYPIPRPHVLRPEGASMSGAGHFADPVDAFVQMRTFCDGCGPCGLSFGSRGRGGRHWPAYLRLQ